MVLTKSRRTLLFIIALAVGGIFVVRQMGDAALEKAIANFKSEGGNLESYGTDSVKRKVNNIARWSEGAVKLMDLDSNDQRFLTDLDHQNPEKMDQKTIARVEELIRRNELPLHVLSKIIPLTESSFELRYWQGLEMPIPNLLEFNATTRLLSAKWRLELLNGDLFAASQTALIQERIASALTNEPVPIMGLIGFVAEKDFHEFIARNITSIDRSFLQLHLEHLKHLQSMAVPLNRVIATDGAMVYDAMSSEFLSKEFFQQGSVTRREWIPLKTSYLFNRPYFLANMLDIYTELLQYSRKPAIQNGIASVNHSWVSTIFFSSNIETIIRRFQAQDAARSLALTALQTRLDALKDGFYKQPDQLPTSPYTHEKASYKILQDGRVELSFPETIKLWNQTFAEKEYVRPPRLIWRLPKL